MQVARGILSPSLVEQPKKAELLENVKDGIGVYLKAYEKRGDRPDHPDHERAGPLGRAGAMAAAKVQGFFSLNRRRGRTPSHAAGSQSHRRAKARSLLYHESFQWTFWSANFFT